MEAVKVTLLAASYQKNDLGFFYAEFQLTDILQFILFYFFGNYVSNHIIYGWFHNRPTL